MLLRGTRALQGLVQRKHGGERDDYPVSIISMPFILAGDRYS